MTIIVKTQDQTITINGAAMSYYSDYNDTWQFKVPSTESDLLLGLLSSGAISKLERDNSGRGYIISFKEENLEAITDFGTPTAFDGE